MTDLSIPEGFKLFPADNSFNDAMAPLYMKITEQGTIFGLRVEQRHSNPMGICHGGVLMTLMDFALSASICHKIEKYLAMPTISMSMDFLAMGNKGDWIWADVECLKVTRKMGFAQGIVRNSEGVALMRASGSFNLPKDIDKAPGINLADLLATKNITL